jgi:hypothetical protein
MSLPRLFPDTNALLFLPKIWLFVNENLKIMDFLDSPMRRRFRLFLDYGLLGQRVKRRLQGIKRILLNSQESFPAGASLKKRFMLIFPLN